MANPDAEAALASVYSSAPAAAAAQADGTSTPPPEPAPAVPAAPPAPPPAQATPAPAEPAAVAPPAAPAPAVPGSSEPAATAGIPPAPPAPGSPPAATTGPITIDINALSPAARRFLEMKGGDFDRALADALDYNNRLGNRAPAPPASTPAATAPPQPGTPPSTTTPPPAPGTAPQAPPAAPPQPSEEDVVAGQVEQLLDSDPESVALVSDYTRIQNELVEIAKQHGTRPREVFTAGIDRDIAYFERRLQEPDVKGDEFALSEVQGKLRDLKNTRNDIRERVRDLEGVRNRYHEITADTRSRVESHRAEERRRADADASIATHAQALEAAWQPGIDRALQRNGIHPDMAKAFGRRAWQSALTSLDHGVTVDNLDAFLDTVASDVKVEWDSAHRARSAEYAANALRRADTPAPAPPGTPPSAAQPQAPTVASLDDLYRQTERDLRQKVSVA